jgi:DNA-binding MarR family transcriptional regulator
MRATTERDQVDDLIDYWCQENPGVDMTTKALAVRIRRIYHHLDRSLRRELAAIDMEQWEFEVLLPLRRSPGHRLSVGELAGDSQVTPGAVTNRVGRLEERGLVRRDVDPADRRQVIVSLTEDGLARSDQMIATKIQADQRAFGSLDKETQKRMLADLRTLLGALERDADDCPGARTRQA